MNWHRNRGAITDSGGADSPARIEEVSESLEDQCLERYLWWRQTCEQVRSAYQDWRRSAPVDREDAFAAYGAALDREQSAARDYSQIARLILSSRR
jgi:hypothetical protein